MKKIITALMVFLLGSSFGQIGPEIEPGTLTYVATSDMITVTFKLIEGTSVLNQIKVDAFISTDTSTNNLIYRSTSSETNLDYQYSFAHGGTPATVFTFRFRAENAFGSSMVHTLIAETLPLQTGLKNLSDDGFKALRDGSNFSIESQKATKYQLYNLLGSCILMGYIEPEEKKQIDISGLKKGYYIMVTDLGTIKLFLD